MVQVPGASNTMEDPLGPVVEQMDGVCEVNCTKSPELAVAPIENPDSASERPARLPNVIVCCALCTLKNCVTAVAGAKTALPSWLATIVQTPVATMDTVLPEMEQTFCVVEVNVTASPELAIAAMENGATTNARSLREPKVIDCAVRLGVVKVTERLGAEQLPAKLHAATV